MNAAKSNIRFLLAVPKAANAQDDVSSFVPVPSTVTFFKYFIQLVAFKLLSKYRSFSAVTTATAASTDP